MNARALLLPVALAACHPAAAPPARPPLAGAAIGGPFALVDQDGRRFTDRDLSGRWRIMYFGYTFCPDVCPRDMAVIGAGLKLVEAQDPALGRRIVPVFVSVDPARDTPGVLKAFVAAFHPRAIGLTGSAEAVARAAAAYRIYYRKGAPAPGGAYMVDHMDVVYLMDPAGHPVALLPGEGTPEAMAAEIRRWAR